MGAVTALLEVRWKTTFYGNRRWTAVHNQEENYMQTFKSALCSETGPKKMEPEDWQIPENVLGLMFYARRDKRNKTMLVAIYVFVILLNGNESTAITCIKAEL